MSREQAIAALSVPTDTVDFRGYTFTVQAFALPDAVLIMENQEKLTGEDIKDNLDLVYQLTVPGILDPDDLSQQLFPTQADVDAQKNRIPQDAVMALFTKRLEMSNLGVSIEEQAGN